MNKDTYKIGDQITFGRTRPKWWSKDGSMDKFLGQTVTIESIYWVPVMNSGTFTFKNSNLKQFWLHEIEESHKFPQIKFEDLNIETKRRINEITNELFGNKQLINKMNKQQKTQVIHDVANALCNAQNQFTTLELKNELRKKYPNEIWNQQEISIEMMDLADQGHFDFYHNGVYRTYSATPSLQGSQAQTTTSNPSMVSQLITKAQTTNSVVILKPQKQPKVTIKPIIKRIGRKKALEIIQNTNGKFFSVRFEKKNGEDRLMGVQYVKGTKPDPLGYVLLRDLKEGKSKSVNLQTLSEIKTNNILYKVN